MSKSKVQNPLSGTQRFFLWFLVSGIVFGYSLNFYDDLQGPNAGVDDLICAFVILGWIFFIFFKSTDFKHGIKDVPCFFGGFLAWIITFGLELLVRV